MTCTIIHVDQAVSSNHPQFSYLTIAAPDLTGLDYQVLERNEHNYKVKLSWTQIEMEDLTGYHVSSSTLSVPDGHRIILKFGRFATTPLLSAAG